MNSTKYIHNKLNIITILILFTVSITNTYGFTSSNLPIISIETNNQSIVRDSRISATIGIIYNGADERNFLSDPFNHFFGNIEIRTRGNSTAGWPKKPYDFKITDDFGEDLHVPLLGMAAHEDWLLIASYLDHTFIRTPLSKHMSRLTGRWASDCRMVEVVLNGSYQGIYILVEKIARSNRRLGIEKLESDQISGEEVTGGYIYEISGQKNNFGETRYLRYPKYETAASQQISYIRQYDDNFRNAMRSANYIDEYPKWIDAGSFVDELIVQEAMRNSDAYGWSSYFHKPRNGKIFAGPVWDFDQSAGNSSYPDNGVVEGWLYSHEGTNNTPFFWEKLMEDPAFRYKVKKKWEALREDAFKTENLFHYIDSIAELLNEAQVREFAKWPVLGLNFWRETTGFLNRVTYQLEVIYLKDFLMQRWLWMDNEIAKIPDLPTGISFATYSSDLDKLLVYPNPAQNYITFDIPGENFANAIINVYSPLGILMHQSVYQMTYGTNSFTINLRSEFNLAMYFYTIFINDEIRFTGRFLKAK